MCSCAGNKPLLEEIRKAASPTKGSAKKAAAGGAGAVVEAGKLVMYNGAMLDIASTLQRLERSEKLKHDTDDRLKELQVEMGE